MNPFTYSYPVKVYFGEKAAEQNLAAELAKHGKTVLLAYGGGSIRKNGVYDELCAILKAAGKEIVEFTGIMSTGFWKMIRDGAVAFAEQYNADGGDATVIDLPQIGLYGNSHFMFQEMNNKEIADHIQGWLEARGL